MSNVDINVDRRMDGRTENRTPISHPATSRWDKNKYFLISPQKMLWVLNRSTSVKPKKATIMSAIAYNVCVYKI